MSTDSSQETWPERSATGKNILKRLARRITGSVRARTIFGEPIEKEGITVIPLARARWATASASEGRGRLIPPSADLSAHGWETVKITPAGYVEVRDGRARFHPMYDPARVTQIIVASGVVAVLLLQAVHWLISRQKMGK
ncbi:MAG TPA: hypothetical protein VFA09_18715 [Ktedonobacteraceae bacterium]|nr:hypothetical protein [Ktedonobacteraceae bacterium]